MLCYHWLLSIHMCTFIFVFPSISRYFPLGVLDMGYHWTGRYFPGITALVFPVYISQPMFALVLVLGVSVLDVLEYLIGENAKYLYLITSTWSIWVLDQLYLTPILQAAAYQQEWEAAVSDTHDTLITSSHSSRFFRKAYLCFQGQNSRCTLGATLKPNYIEYPAIHTNYSWSNCTIWN